MCSIKKKFDIKKYLLYIIIGVMIFVSDDTILFGTNLNNSFIVIKFLIFVILVFMLLGLIKIENINLGKKTVHFTMTLSLLIIITSIYNFDYKFGYLYRILIMILGLLITSYIPIEKFAIYYNNIMKLLSIFSLIGFGTEIFFKSLLTKFPIITNSAYKQFYNLILTNIPVQNWGVPRNYGIFREPGVFQMFLIIALIIQLFVLKKKSIVSQLIFVVTLLTTSSTTGYIAIACVFIVYLFNKEVNRSIKQNKKFFLFYIIIILGYVIIFTGLLNNDNQYMSVFAKLNNETGTSARFASISINLELFLNSPIFGQGITNIQDKFQTLAQRNFGVSSEHNTNTLLIQFSTYGLTFSLLWMYGIYKTCQELVIKRHLALLIFLIINILFIGENISNNLILSSFVFYGFKHTKVDSKLILT